MGAKKFVAQCEDYAKRFGDRFTPNKLLREMADKNQTFYSRFAPVKQAA
jgi:3-hydroxyacyl-CoA dehydrogenase/enoyl-CoA hydratase/3-hydroxybutyryl-CoA epimerase